jgi:hypothetical protein
MPKGSGARPRATAAPPPRGRANPRRITAVAEDVDPGERELTETQAAVEGVELKETVEFFGEEYRLAPKVGLMPLLKFAHAANQGVGADDMEGMAALYAIIRDVVYRGEPACGECEDCKRHPDEPARCQYFEAGDWDRFERAAIDEQADGDQLLDFVHEAIEQISARPTNAPSGSSSRARSTSPKSREPSPRVVQGRTLPPGAEDLRPVDELLR